MTRSPDTQPSMPCPSIFPVHRGEAPHLSTPAWRACALQASIRRQAAPPPEWEDPDEVVEWVTALVDDALEGVDSALDAFKRGDEASEGAAGGPAGQRQGARVGGRAARGTLVAPAGGFRGDLSVEVERRAPAVTARSLLRLHPPLAESTAVWCSGVGVWVFFS